MSKINLFQDLVPSLRKANLATLSLTRQFFGSEAESIDSLCQMIMESDGEYSSLVIANRILATYENLDDVGRNEFFTLLCSEYDLDVDAVAERLERYRHHPDARALEALSQAVEPRRQALFRLLNMVPDGTARLVRMREHLLGIIKTHPELARIDVDLRHLFASWFNRGFLVMQPIDWTTPAHILEKIIAYEAVHEIGSWRELRNRLEPQDRHCFAFFHPAMGDEPLVFVEVALTNAMTDRIVQILDVDRERVDPHRATHAIFYSISSCHRGLSGVSFGNFLIKQVAISLRQQFPLLKKFATLSPVPGFRKWLEQQDEDTARELLVEQSDIADSKALAARHQKLLEHAAKYFLNAKTPGSEPLDPVARFHLKNGAELNRLNPDADSSTKSINQSLGLMVNYVYDLARVESNHELYMQQNRIVCSSQIRKLAG